MAQNADQKKKKDGPDSSISKNIQNQKGLKKKKKVIPLELDKDENLLVMIVTLVMLYTTNH